MFFVLHSGSFIIETRDLLAIHMYLDIFSTMLVAAAAAIIHIEHSSAITTAWNDLRKIVPSYIS